MITARSHNLPAIAIPGDHAWQPQWAQLLTGRHITIVMDADPAGRAAACRIHHDLRQVANAHIVDLAPDRDDGYDLTDWLADNPYLVDVAIADFTASANSTPMKGEQ